VTAGLRRELGLLPLVAVVFFNVSGGPYGVEDAVSAFGPGLALLLLALTPLVYSLPVSLAMSELAAALPEEGGYVVWVRRVFGPFWAFQVGWWSWLNSFVDVAVYPALFSDYARYWWPELGGPARLGIALAFVWALTALNVAGVRITGHGAVALGLGALAPVAVLVAVALARAEHVPWRPFAVEGQGLWSGLGLGLAVTMWNYSGWDNPSTCLGETRAPERAYRRAVLASLPLISLGYLLPVGLALSATSGWSEWQTGHLPAVGAALGGPWLGGLLALGAALSTAGLFLAGVLTNSRLPFVLARAGQLPAWIGAVHPRFGTPWAAVLLSSACYSLLAPWDFKDLIVLNVWLYSLTLLLELAAFVALRLREPGLPRPWRVPGGVAGMWLAAGLPAALSLLAIGTAGWLNSAAGIAAALSGPAAWAWWRRGAAVPPRGGA
jgi:amino acid transporter